MREELRCLRFPWPPSALVPFDRAGEVLPDEPALRGSTTLRSRVDAFCRRFDPLFRLLSRWFSVCRSRLDDSLLVRLALLPSRCLHSLDLLDLPFEDFLFLSSSIWQVSPFPLLAARSLFLFCLLRGDPSLLFSAWSDTSSDTLFSLPLSFLWGLALGNRLPDRSLEGFRLDLLDFFPADLRGLSSSGGLFSLTSLLSRDRLLVPVDLLLRPRDSGLDFDLLFLVLRNVFGLIDWSRLLEFLDGWGDRLTGESRRFLCSS